MRLLILEGIGLYAHVRNSILILAAWAIGTFALALRLLPMDVIALRALDA